MGEFLRNSWYCAGWAADLSDKPIGIKILGEDSSCSARATAVRSRWPGAARTVSRRWQMARSSAM